MKNLVLSGSLIFLFLSSFFTPQTIFSQSDSAMSLTSSTQYAHLGNVITTNDDVTMEAWVYWSGSTAANQLIFYNGNTGNAGYGLMISYGDGDKLGILCGGNVFQPTGKSLYQNAWNHVALTKKGNEFVLYVNGIQEYNAILPFADPSFGTPPDFMIGGNPAGSESLKGYIDEVRIWNTVRTPVEIFKNAGAALTGTETGLVALYHFNDDRSSGTVVDAGPNVLNLTTNGSPTFVASTASSQFLRQQVYLASSGGTSATIKWLADPHSNVDKYIVYKGFDTNPLDSVGVTSSRTDTTFTIPGLASDTVYYFVARASSPAGKSDYYRLTAVSTYPGAGNAGNFSYNPYYEVSNNQNIPVGNSSYTLEAWIKPSGMGDYGIVGWGNYGYYGSVNALRLYNNGIHHYWWDNDLSVETGDISGSWHHVAVTYDGTTRKMYFDGILRASDNPGSHTVPFTATLTIGKTYGSEYFYGDMDELRIWNVARTEAEITAAASSPLTGQETGLVSLYHFDESDGQYLLDQAGANFGIAANGTVGRTPSGGLELFPPYSVFAIPGNQQVELTWTPSASPNIDHYDLYYAKGQGSNNPILFATAGAGETYKLITEVNAEPLKNDSVYLFAVKAVDVSSRASDFGNHLEAIPTVKAGNALLLEQDYEYIDVNHNNEFNFADSITISAWIKTSDSTERYITTKTEDSWYLAINGGNTGYGKVTFYLNGPSNPYGWLVSSDRIDDGRWHHITATYDGTDMKIYIDGHLSSSLSTGGSIYTSTSSVQIGARNGNSTFNGEIDELSFWKKAMDQAEIRSHIFNPLRGDESGLIALYHFNEPDANNYVSDGVHGMHNGSFQVSESTIDMVPSGAMTGIFAPHGLYTTADTGRVKLHWEANFESNFMRYRIFVSDVSDFSNIIKLDSTASGNINDTTKTISGLTNFTTYYFRLTAVLNDGTESVYSPTVQSTPTIFQNVPFTFPDLEDKNLAWGDYDDDGDYDLLVVGGNSHFGGGFATIYRNTGGTFAEQSLGLKPLHGVPRRHGATIITTDDWMFPIWALQETGTAYSNFMKTMATGRLPIFLRLSKGSPKVG